MFWLAQRIMQAVFAAFRQVPIPTRISRMGDYAYWKSGDDWYKAPCRLLDNGVPEIDLQKAQKLDIMSVPVYEADAMHRMLEFLNSEQT